MLDSEDIDLVIHLDNDAKSCGVRQAGHDGQYLRDIGREQTSDKRACACRKKLGGYASKLPPAISSSKSRGTDALSELRKRTNLI